RHDLLALPEVFGRALALDRAVHRPLEQDGAEDPITVEDLAGDDPAAHLVDEPEHLLVVGVLRLLDAVLQQRLGRAATALVERSEKALAVLHLVQLLCIHRMTPFPPAPRPFGICLARDCTPPCHYVWRPTIGRSTHLVGTSGRGSAPVIKQARRRPP